MSQTRTSPPVTPLARFAIAGLVVIVLLVLVALGVNIVSNPRDHALDPGVVCKTEFHSPVAVADQPGQLDCQTGSGIKTPNLLAYCRKLKGPSATIRFDAAGHVYCDTHS